jgi:hypothetical protein
MRAGAADRTCELGELSERARVRGLYVRPLGDEMLAAKPRVRRLARQASASWWLNWNRYGWRVLRPRKHRLFSSLGLCRLLCWYRNWLALINGQSRWRYAVVFVAIAVLAITFVTEILVENQFASQGIGAIEPTAKSSNALLFWIKNVVVFGPSPDIREPQFILSHIKQARLGAIENIALNIPHSASPQSFLWGDIGRPFNGTPDLDRGKIGRQIVMRELIVDEICEVLSRCPPHIIPLRHYEITNQNAVQLARNDEKIIQGDGGSQAEPFLIICGKPLFSGIPSRCCSSSKRQDHENKYEPLKRVLLIVCGSGLGVAGIFIAGFMGPRSFRKGLRAGPGNLDRTIGGVSA